MCSIFVQRTWRLQCTSIFVFFLFLFSEFCMVVVMLEHGWEVGLENKACLSQSKSKHYTIIQSAGSGRDSKSGESNKNKQRHIFSRRSCFAFSCFAALVNYFKTDRQAPWHKVSRMGQPAVRSWKGGAGPAGCQSGSTEARLPEERALDRPKHGLRGRLVVIGFLPSRNATKAENMCCKHPCPGNKEKKKESSTGTRSPAAGLDSENDWREHS